MRHAREASLIELHIEELVLDRTISTDLDAVGESLRAELTGLFLASGLSAPSSADHAVDRLDGGSFSIGRDAGAHTIGDRIARSVHDGLAGWVSR